MQNKISAMLDQIERQAFFGTCTSTAATESEPFTMGKMMEAIDRLRDIIPLPPPPRIVESTYHADRVEDWSGVRSPSRARRRRRMGHKQRVKVVYVPWTHATQLPNGMLVMHPATAQRFREALKREAVYLPTAQGGAK